MIHCKIPFKKKTPEYKLRIVCEGKPHPTQIYGNDGQHIKDNLIKETFFYNDNWPEIFYGPEWTYKVNIYMERGLVVTKLTYYVEGRDVFLSYTDYLQRVYPRFNNQYFREESDLILAQHKEEYKKTKKEYLELVNMNIEVDFIAELQKTSFWGKYHIPYNKDD